MTDPQGPGADKIAELEKGLAEASAQMAQVQAQLREVAGAHGLPEVSVQTLGEDHLQSPVVLMGGQPVGDVDLTELLGMERADQVRRALSQLGLDQNITGLFGGVGQAGPGSEAAPATPVAVERLAEPPRPVPMSFRFAAFSWSWWELFGIIMGFTAPLAVWGFFPVAIPGGFIAALLVIAFIRGRKYLRRMALLKWGKVATVTNANELSRGTYYAGTTYKNMIVPQAHGWDVTRDWYSGPASVSEINYTLDGQRGVLKLRGLPYASGVILANSRKPTQALCVSQFPYVVKPDGNGDFVAHLRTRTWFGIAATLLIHAALVVGAAASAAQFWF